MKEYTFLILLLVSYYLLGLITKKNYLTRVSKDWRSDGKVDIFLYSTQYNQSFNFIFFFCNVIKLLLGQMGMQKLNLS